MSKEIPLPSQIDLSKIQTWSSETETIVQAFILSLIENGNTWESPVTWADIKERETFFTSFDAFCTMVKGEDFDHISGRDPEDATTFLEPVNREGEIITRKNYLDIPLRISGRVKKLLEALNNTSSK